MHSVRLTPATRAQVVPAALALVCYLGALRNGFAYDNVFIVLNNSAIHSWATIPAALHLPYWYTTGYLYRPLTTLSFAIDWIVSGGAPVVFHAVNIVWHAVAAALVARLALRWWSPIAATAAGCIFAVHPVHVEVVANIVGRSELLSAVALLALALVASRPLPPGATAPAHANGLPSAYWPPSRWRARRRALRRPPLHGRPPG